MIRLNLKWGLIVFFVMLGPIGNILTPNFLPKSFRLYYFLLPFFPLFFLMTKARLAKIGIIFLPVFSYAYFSSHCVEKFGSANESHTLFRFYLLLCQFFFVLGAAAFLEKKEEVTFLLKTYIYAFFVSMFIGYVFLLGFYTNTLPLSLIERFSILTQFGWGILRFSPGSYPNEYGVVASFVLSVLTLIYIENRQSFLNLTKTKFTLLYSATFMAFLLTTTRAAYLSFFVSFIYITIKERNFKKILFRSFIFLGIAFSTIKWFLGLNMVNVFRYGFTQKINEGSLGERYEMWQKSLERLEGNELLGVGFASLTNIHNVYIQLLFELGIIGSLLLVISLIFASIESFFSYPRPKSDDQFQFFQKIRMVGLINVLSFAASNHNLNHHLTWFVLFLCFISLRFSYLSPRLKNS